MSDLKLRLIVAFQARYSDDVTTEHITTTTKHDVVESDDGIKNHLAKNRKLCAMF